ncbi:MAG: DUF1993 domain-containing protein [Legionella sp.]|nr:DUF1993 domain-containing protein [Legionella sp.]
MNSSISMYNASVPVFKQLLTALNAILDKAQTHCINNAIAPDSLLKASLYPDMFDFTRQVQIAADFAKGVSARLAGIEVPAYEDTETSFNELQARIEKTLLFISSITPEDINGSEDKEIVTRPGTPKEKRFNGQSYLLSYGLPQFFFHVTTAYDILRNQGVEVGKRDYMGAF